MAICNLRLDKEVFEWRLDKNFPILEEKDEGK
jgi:hypothetical protein